MAKNPKGVAVAVVVETGTEPAQPTPATEPAAQPAAPAPGLARFRAPQTLGSISYQGTLYTAHDGHVDLPPDFPADLRASLGLTPEG